jgi:hypothetical protein
MVARTDRAEADAHFPDGTRALTPAGMVKLLDSIETFIAKLVKRPAAQWTSKEVAQLLMTSKLTAAHLSSEYTTMLR